MFYLLSSITFLNHPHSSIELITEEFPKSTIKSSYTSPSLNTPKQSANDTVVILSSDSEDDDDSHRGNQKKNGT